MNIDKVVCALCQHGRNLSIGVNCNGITAQIEEYDWADGCVRRGIYGVGNTVSEAIIDYANQINGKEMRTLSYESSDKEQTFSLVFVD